ncbi:MAG: hypothetical protein IJZ47_12070 [Oscillospiraceae bacterium]|nr:hypothetical protein [Oscillospiraceae bacterium]
MFVLADIEWNTNEQMHGFPTQQEREWREAMNAINKNHEMRMKEIWGDKWREHIR